ncbi:MAG: serine/threonine-protein kinase, partial [Planktothrix sp.]|uniref:serine/threonine-protein kinase n=1 Tax=Planktothrix sp. TaxID=3088171 RepID=UPI0038D3AB40
MNKQLLWRMLEGKVINNQYYLNKLLGAGGFGGVFLADEVIRDKFIRQVAIKLIIYDNNNEGQLNELIAATNLQHPNLIRCFYGSECNLNGADFLYLVMEVADFSLEKRLTKSILSETETTLLVQDITEALVYLHSQSKAIVHRDLKPGNVLRVGDKWKLSDFGLVKIIGSGSVSNTNTLSGTAQYIPPEAYGWKDQSAASDEDKNDDKLKQIEIAPAWDVWALGIIIVEVLTGKLPFQGETLQQLQKQVCDVEPNLSGVPKKFESIVWGCLQKHRRKRWTSQQILDELYRNTKQSKNITIEQPNINLTEGLMWLKPICSNTVYWLMNNNIVNWFIKWFRNITFVRFILWCYLPLVFVILAKYYTKSGDSNTVYWLMNNNLVNWFIKWFRN